MRMTKTQLEHELKQQKLQNKKVHSLYRKHKHRIEEIQTVFQKQQKAMQEANRLSDELSMLIMTFNELEKEVIKEYEND
jgi:DNA repair ATPase RecN